MNMESDFLKDLNREQKQAATHKDGPLLIVAGAGTGKTTVITRRIAWLIDQKLAKPEEILALTFTDKAANEMEERVDRLLPMGYVNTCISTFHSFCQQILENYGIEIGLPDNFRIFTPTQLWILAYNNFDKFHLDYYKPLGNPTRFIRALIQHFSRAKDELISPEDYLEYVENARLNQDTEIDIQELQRIREVANAYHVYQRLLLENNVLDFGDLINYSLKLFQERHNVLKKIKEKYKYILVDEFQDTNYAQYALLKLLAAPENNIIVVGDDDQSVYRFRNASIANILEFKNDYPDSKEIFLTKNYRSFQNILDKSYNFIQQNNPYRLETKLNCVKQLRSDKDGQGVVNYSCYPNANDEAKGVCEKIIELQKENKTNWSDFAILLRANSSAPLFLQALSMHKIPFDYVASRGLYQTKIIVEILNYLRILDNNQDSDTLYSVLASESFLMSMEDLVKFAQYAKQRTISLFEAVKNFRPSNLADPPVPDKAIKMIEKHIASMRTANIAELYINIIRDLGIEERLAHPGLVREAGLIASFYQQIERFESENEDKSLHNFIQQLDLEIESGEEGQLPADFDEGPDTVKVITAHSAKGLEWKYVFIVQLIDKRFPSISRKDLIELPDDLIKEALPEGDAHLQEERRLFYVAMTRARDGLYLTNAKDYFGKTTRKSSRFLQELEFVSDTEKTGKKIVENIVMDNEKESHYAIPESFSFSSLSSFSKCPLEFKFRHLLKMPCRGSAQLSFGSTIHKTLERFLKIWQSKSNQKDLFGLAAKPALPSWEELKKIYEQEWIDDWYVDSEQKKKYKTIEGPKQLKVFYDNFANDPPKVKYIEEFFKIQMGDYKFVGKIDRVDQLINGYRIVDYKTGSAPFTKLDKTGKDQLVIYQIAAKEFFGLEVLENVYWYLGLDKFSEPFVAKKDQIEKVQEEYIEAIEKIIQTIKNDSFESAEKDAPRHDCQYKHLL